MRSAIDSATGQEILAERSTSRRPYTCPNCGKSVKLRSGEQLVYFAHETGVADEECDLYTSPRIHYTGRRYLRSPASQSGPFLQSDHLSFGMGSMEPQLGLFLPPTDTEEWTGSIRFIAERVSRTFRWQHLRQGHGCRFSLADGRWTVVPEGDVDESYLERIEVGPQVLAEGQNLFDASREFGRQILPGESLYAGDAIWWISRNAIRVPLDLSDLVAVIPEKVVKDWFIYRITITVHLDAGKQRDGLANWLQRPIRPRRARVWVEQPWAAGQTALGVAAYDVVDGPFSIRSEQPADIAIRSVKSGELVAFGEMSTQLGWQHPKTGNWELLVNGSIHEIFNVSEALQWGGNAMVRVDGGPPTELTQVQPVLDAFAQSGKAVCPIEVSWGEESVGELITINGNRILPGNKRAVSLSLTPGQELSIDMLGNAAWTPPIKLKAHAADPEPLRRRATWLLTVSERGGRGSERIRVPDRWEHEPLLRSLRAASWRRSLAPQVRALQRLLEERQ